MSFKLGSELSSMFGRKFDSAIGARKSIGSTGKEKSKDERARITGPDESKEDAIPAAGPCLAINAFEWIF